MTGPTAERRPAVPLGDLIAAALDARAHGPLDVAITHFSADSRAIGAGGLFVATRGFTGDGHDYIERALAQGAAAILAEIPPPAGGAPSATWITAPDSTYALAVVADAFWGHPSREVAVLATTGTNGKTTVTWLLYEILRAAGATPGLMSTVEVRYGEVRRDTIFTTPPAPAFQQLLAEMRAAGCTHAVVEASSHGLHQHRLAAFEVAVGGFTNLTRDHLDYHPTMEDYLEAKARLFRHLARRACFNVDDPAGRALAQSFPGERLTVSRRGAPDADLRALDVVEDLTGIRARLVTSEGALALETPLIGGHNLENALVAVGMARLAGIPFEVAVGALATARGAPGRLERVPGARDVFVDYAHTPDALANVLSALRPLADRRLLCVFGAGGDRDRGKRPEMAAASARLADLTVVTSDNPRTEDPEAIVADIVAGLPADHPRRVILDRREAIRWAVWEARPGDVVLIAGKGHEPYQIVGEERLPFDDVAVAGEAMEGLP